MSVEMRWKKVPISKEIPSAAIRFPSNGIVDDYMVLQYRNKSVRSPSQMQMMVNQPMWQPAPDAWTKWQDVEISPIADKENQ